MIDLDNPDQAIDFNEKLYKEMNNVIDHKIDHEIEHEIDKKSTKSNHESNNNNKSTKQSIKVSNLRKRTSILSSPDENSLNDNSDQMTIGNKENTNLLNRAKTILIKQKFKFFETNQAKDNKSINSQKSAKSDKSINQTVSLVGKEDSVCFCNYFY